MCPGRVLSPRDTNTHTSLPSTSARAVKIIRFEIPFHTKIRAGGDAVCGEPEKQKKCWVTETKGQTAPTPAPLSPFHGAMSWFPRHFRLALIARNICSSAVVLAWKDHLKTQAGSCCCCAWHGLHHLTSRGFISSCGRRACWGHGFVHPFTHLSESCAQYI